MLGNGLVVAALSLSDTPRGQVMTQRLGGSVLSCVGSRGFRPRRGIRVRRIRRLFAGMTNSPVLCAGSSPSRLGPGVG